MSLFVQQIFFKEERREPEIPKLSLVDMSNKISQQTKTRQAYGQGKQLCLEK